MDNRGRNFLHLAIQKSDIESVLFLISVRANVNSRVQDSAMQTPLHLAVHVGSEIIVRNLVWHINFILNHGYYPIKSWKILENTVNVDDIVYSRIIENMSHS